MRQPGNPLTGRSVWTRAAWRTAFTAAVFLHPQNACSDGAPDL